MLALCLIACSPPQQPPAPPVRVEVVDGDNLRIDGVNTRLLGIDAPEMPSRCRRGRVCAPGDPIASRASLEAALALGPITVETIGKDRYGRPLALVRAGTADLSCWQLRAGQAVYKPDWDNGRRVRARCPDAAR